MKKMNPKLTAFFLTAFLLLSLKTPVQASNAAFAPVFDSTYYAETHPDLKAALGTDETILLYHFISSGMAEGRQANAEFDVQIYRNNYADLDAVFGDDLFLYYMHYIQSGKAEGRIANQNLNATNAPSSGRQSSPHNMFTKEQWDFANRVIELVNLQRAAYGLNSVSGVENLFSAAQERALEIETLFSHTRPNGESCFTVFDNYNVPHGWAGENIAAGQDTPEEVVIDWMNSPGHRANILNEHFNHLGVGCHTTNTAYGIYWVQMFTD